MMHTLITRSRFDGAAALDVDGVTLRSCMRAIGTNQMATARH